MLVLQVRMEPSVLREQWVRRGFKEFPGLLVKKERRAIREMPARPDLQVQPVRRVLWDSLAQPANRVKKVTKAYRESWVHRVSRDFRGRKVTRGMLERSVLSVLKAPREIPVWQAPSARRAPREMLAWQALLALKAKSV